MAHLLERTQPYYVGGTLTGVQPVAHYDYRLLRHSPAELRAEFAKLGGRASWRSRRATRCTGRTRS